MATQATRLYERLGTNKTSLLTSANELSTHVANLGNLLAQLRVRMVTFARTVVADTTHRATFETQHGTAFQNCFDKINHINTTWTNTGVKLQDIISKIGNGHLSPEKEGDIMLNMLSINEDIDLCLQTLFDAIEPECRRFEEAYAALTGVQHG